MSLPAGTPTYPIVVQFSHNGCYLINGNLDLRDFTDVTFDGNGSTLKQTNIYPLIYQYTDTQGASTCGTGPAYGGCYVVSGTSGHQPVYCGDASDLFGVNTTLPGHISYDGGIPKPMAIMWWVEGGCDLTWRNFNLQGSFGGGRTVNDAAYSSGSTTLTSSTASFAASDVGDSVTGSSNIPTGTTIVAVNSATQVLLSHATTGGGSGQTVTFSYVDSSSSPQQDSLIQLNGVQRVTIANNTMSNPWGDWVTIFGVHEALPSQGNNGAFPSTDVTITDNQLTGTTGRQGISPIFVTRADISHNNITGSTSATMFDLEADTQGYCTCDVNIHDNTVSGSYAYLLSAQTGTQVDRLAFTNNQVSQLRFIMDAATGSSDITIANNTASQTWGDPLPAIDLSDSNTATLSNVLVVGNKSPVHIAGTGAQPFVFKGTNPSDPNLVVANNTLTGTPASYGQAILSGPGTTCGNTVNGTAVDGSCGTYTTPAQPQALTLPADFPDTAVGRPSNGTIFGGTQYLDASASDESAVTSLQFEITGGSFDDYVVSTATSSSVGWIGGWNTTSVPDGLYILQSVACNAEGNCSSSGLGTWVMVDNTPPTTAIVLPSTGTVFGGSQYLDAIASDNSSVTNVQFQIVGGSLNNDVVSTATLTAIGWIGGWNTAIVPDGTYFLESVATDAAGNVGRSPAIVITVDNAPPTTAIVLPSTGTVFGGSQYLDATASDDSSVTKVQFQIVGGSLNNDVVSTATSTYVGWIGGWNTATVPDGTYFLESVATDAAGNVGRSPAIVITVDNTPPTTAVVLPANGATLTGSQYLDATASDDSSVTNVQFELTGGTLNNDVVSTATSTAVGWLGGLNTSTVPNGTYTLQSVATDAAGNVGLSPGITVKIAN